jgi:hypothetical protein
MLPLYNEESDSETEEQFKRDVQNLKSKKGLKLEYEANYDYNLKLGEADKKIISAGGIMNALVVREPSNNFSSQIVEVKKESGPQKLNLSQREVRFMDNHRGIQGGDRDAEVRLGGFW